MSDSVGIACPGDGERGGAGRGPGAGTTGPSGTADPEGADPELDFDLENKLFPEKGEGARRGRWPHLSDP